MRLSRRHSISNTVVDFDSLPPAFRRKVCERFPLYVQVSRVCTILLSISALFNRDRSVVCFGRVQDLQGQQKDQRAQKHSPHHDMLEVVNKALSASKRLGIGAPCWQPLCPKEAWGCGSLPETVAIPSTTVCTPGKPCRKGHGPSVQAKEAQNSPIGCLMNAFSEVHWPMPQGLPSLASTIDILCDICVDRLFYMSTRS
jgi:hypothetical protein